MHSTVLVKKSQMIRHVQKNLKFSLKARIVTLVLGDVFLLAISALLALWEWTVYMGLKFTSDNTNKDVFWLILPFLAIFVLTDSYHLKNMRNFMRSMKQPLRAASIICITYIVIYFFAPRNSLPRVVVLLFGVTSAISLVLWRNFAFFYLFPSWLAPKSCCC